MKWALPFVRKSGNQSSSFETIDRYPPCVPTAGLYSTPLRNWSGQPSRHILAAHGHKQHRQSYHLRFWHRQSDNKTTVSVLIIILGLIYYFFDTYLNQTGILDRIVQQTANLGVEAQQVGFSFSLF